MKNFAGFVGFSDAALDRIVTAVAQGHAKIRRDHLRDSLNMTVARYLIESESGSRKVRRDQSATVSIVQKTSELLNLLDAEGHKFAVAHVAAIYDRGRHFDIDTEEPPTYYALVEGLRALNSAAKKSDRLVRRSRKISPRTAPVLQSLIGRDLVLVYERHFGRVAGRSNPPGGGTPFGPFVRFVQAFVEEVNAAGGHMLNPSPHTIGTYLKRFRASQPIAKPRHRRRKG